jgi:hypothetical protein
LIGSSEKLDGQDNRRHDQQERSRRTQKVSDDDSRQPVRSMRDVRVATATFRKFVMVQHASPRGGVVRRMPKRRRARRKDSRRIYRGSRKGEADPPVRHTRFLYKIFI